MDYEHWQARWDLQQESYMPDREARFAALLDVVDAACGEAPRVIDLAGGTGSITRRLLARFPGAHSVVVDLDPALLDLARRTFERDARVRIVSADLSRSTWREQVAPTSVDAVLTATALHWLEPDRVRELYAESHGLLVPGGVFANVDHMRDDGLFPLHDAFDRLSTARADQHRAQTGSTDWAGWWTELGKDPEMASLVEARTAIFGAQSGHSHTRSEMPSQWHLAALQDAGFGAAGLAWRCLDDALVVGVA
ncbi:MAG: class I SAM-dependent methyltransferase [Acidimicrobiales bacterium]